ncbi:MAG TPA: SBBP repeat-containing protein, partial [Tepidisphaeraceae bacterium]|nr:SBBP repeat-containing protein [Tepidisphaeraceae bacterium]
MDRAANRRFGPGVKSLQSAAFKTTAEMLERRILLSAAPLNSPVALLGNSPAVFVQNRGQWDDKNVDYALQSSSANVLMTDYGPVFQLFDQSSGSSKSGDEFSAGFEGANAVTPTGLDRSAGKYNYFVGDQSNWLSSVPGYQKIVYNNLYNGINLIVAGKSSSIKYEFDVAPGADPSQVKINYSGIAGLSIDHLGRLHIQTKSGDLIDDAPFVYQTINGKQVQVKAHFKLLDDHSYTFQLDGSYDPSQQLVLDPNLVWSTFLGCAADDSGSGIVADAAGNSYITGETSSAAFPTTNGFDSVLAGTDAFVTKLDTSGQVVWSTFLGGSLQDFGAAVALDNSNNVYVAGQTSSTDFPTTGGFDTTLAGPSDAFVTKITANGALSWSSYLGGSSADNATGIGVDNNGIVYVAGGTSSSDFISTNGFQTARGGSQDGFITAINPNPVAVKWSTYLGGNNTDSITGLVVSQAGTVGVVGTTTSTTNLATVGANDVTFGGVSDAFVASIAGAAASPVLTWATYLGGGRVDSGAAIAMSTAGDIFVTGSTNSTDFLPATQTTTPLVSSLGGFQEAFVTHYAAAGTLTSSTYYGNGSTVLPTGTTGGNTTGNGIAVDAAGNIYLVGSTAAHTLPGIANGFNSVFGGGGRDGFFAVIGTGNTLQSSFLGGSDIDQVVGVSASGNGDVFVTGFTQSTDFPAFFAFDTSFNGVSDAFVARISPAGFPVVPFAPFDLSAAAISFTEIDLNWTDPSTTDHFGFEIFRRLGPNGPYTSIAKVGATIHTYKDKTGLLPGNQYFYRVRAFAFGTNSDFSNAAKATTPSAALAAPTDLNATAVSATRVDLTWKDNSDNETVFEIFRRAVSDLTFAQVATAPENATSFSDQTPSLVAGTQYLYEVRASNTFADSNFSNVALVTTQPADFIIAPSGLTATRINGNVTLNWLDNSANETGFAIQRTVAGSTNFATIATIGANLSTFIDINADPNTVYLYRVQAINNTT